MYVLGICCGLGLLFLVALVPWLGFGNVLGSADVEKKEKRKVLFMPFDDK